MSPRATYRHSEEVGYATTAAPLLVPTILEIVGPISSVVDVGGGSGAWLREFQNQGVSEILLVDRPEAGSELLIDPAAFKPCDLARTMPSLPRFNLAVCVECAEHLASDRAAPLVECITGATDLVVFAAAIPWQGGLNHINEQPHDYWRSLFADKNFDCHDVLRSRIIHNSKVPFWYRQNLFLYAKRGTLLPALPQDFLPQEFNLVHRDILKRYLGPPGLRSICRYFVPQLFRAVFSRLSPSHTRVGK